MSQNVIRRNWSRRAKRFLFGDPKPMAPSVRDNPQDTAPVFNFLPLEIRCQIWEAYFHSHVANMVHIYHSGKETIECLCEDGQKYTPKDHAVCHREQRKRNRLYLLLTCKRIYFESVPLLYRATLFDFSTSLGAVSNFRSAVPAYHLACVTKVNIAYILTWRHAPGPPETKGYRSDASRQWPVIWESLAAMENLQWLRFEVLLASFDIYAEAWMKSIDHVLRPVKLVTQPPHFELILPFDVGDWAEELPCQVVRSEAKDGWK